MDWTTCVAFSPAAQQLTGTASEQTSSHLYRPGEGGAGKGAREGARMQVKEGDVGIGIRGRYIEEEGGWRKTTDYI